MKQIIRFLIIKGRIWSLPTARPFNDIARTIMNFSWNLCKNKREDFKWSVTIYNSQKTHRLDERSSSQQTKSWITRNKTESYGDHGNLVSSAKTQIDEKKVYFCRTVRTGCGCYRRHEYFYEVMDIVEQNIFCFGCMTEQSFTKLDYVLDRQICH